MAATINTNINSITAQRNLAMSASSLSTSMQRLSSGLRVNSAKDDAAGLSISERMNSQVRGLTVAARNANDGISMAQTAEGALGNVSTMLQRMRELAVQSGNSTNSDADRDALQAEVTQLRDEIDRVAKVTNFNGRNILDGTFAGGAFQVGANSGDTITVGSLANTRADGLSDVAYAYDKTTSNVAASSVNTLTSIAAGTLTITVGTGTAIDLGSITAASSGQERMGQVVEAINRKTGDTGVTAFLRVQTDGQYAIDVMSSKLDTNGDAAAVTLAGFSAVTTGLALTGLATSVNSTTTTTDAIGIDTLDVKNQANAWVALKKIDSAINQVNSSRANLGALQSRFENSVSNIGIQTENLSAARGRIVDADFASETANLSRTQILQQAGTAIVAQANQLPQVYWPCFGKLFRGLVG